MSFCPKHHDGSVIILQQMRFKPEISPEKTVQDEQKNFCKIFFQPPFSSLPFWVHLFPACRYLFHLWPSLRITNFKTQRCRCQAERPILRHIRLRSQSAGTHHGADNSIFITAKIISRSRASQFYQLVAHLFP